MIQSASANLTTTFTHKFVVKAIIPRLKLALANISGAMTFALDHVDPMRGNFITLSTPTTSNQTEVTLVVTSPSGLISYNVPLVIFVTGATVLETYNAEDEWVGYTVSGAGIAVGTTVVAYTARRPEQLSATFLRSGPSGGGGFSLELRQKTQIRIDTNALGIPWVEGAGYTFEVSEGFVIDTDTERGFTSPAQNISYTANPPLAIESSDPAPGSVSTETNDYVTFTINRPILPYIGENFYFYKSTGGADTLLKTFPINSGIISGRTVTLDVRGLMQDSTTYYVKSDDEILRDSDNFVFNQLTTDFGFRFTSAGQPAFPDFAALVMSAGAISGTITRIRRILTQSISLAATITANVFKVKQFNVAISVASSLISTASRRRSSSSVISAISSVNANVTGIAGYLIFMNATSTMTMKTGYSIVYAAARNRPDLVPNFDQDKFGAVVAIDAAASGLIVASPTMRNNLPSPNNVGGYLQTGAVYSFNIDEYNAYIPFQLSNGYDFSDRPAGGSNTQFVDSSANTSDWTQNSLTEGDRFGEFVGMSGNGNFYAVGSPGENTPGTNPTSCGCAYVFYVSGYDGADIPLYGFPIPRYVFKIENTFADIAANDEFGKYVSMNYDGRYLAITRPGGGTSGQVHIYTRSNVGTVNNGGVQVPVFGWTLQTTFDAATLGVTFMTQTKFSDDATYLSIKHNSGALVYTRSGTTWTLQTNLDVAFGSINTFTPFDMNADGNFIAFGEPNNTVYKGRVLLYKRTGTTWSLNKVFTASNGTSYDYFGASVSITKDGTRIVVGAPGNIALQPSKDGIAYVYTKTNGTTWVEEILLPTGAAFQQSGEFGCAVAINSDNNVIVVGYRGKEAYSAGINKGGIQYYVITPV